MAFIEKFDGSTDSTVTLGKEGNPKSIEGYFLGSKTVNSDYGPGKLHILQTKSGTIGVWGKTRLNQLLTDDLRGQMVRVSFTGMIQPSKKGKRPSYGFSVKHDSDNTIPVGSISLDNPVADSEDDEEDFIGDGTEHQGAFDGVDVEEELSPPPKAVRKAADPARAARIQALLNKKA